MTQTKRTPEVQAMWEKLERFQLNSDDAVFDYSARLAKENGWSRAYTARVVQEYKRFLLMAMFAGHPVTPSDAVDQAWHLHLVYTRSYWQKLCGEILGRPLHHEPTAGGFDETAKFEAQYDRTLESYRSLFGDEPPADIWPSVQDVFKPKKTRWVDVSRHWLLPKPTWFRLPAFATVKRVALGLTLVTALASCNEYLNVFDWRGTEFLKFYGVAFLVAFVLSLILVRLYRGSAGRSRELITDRYDIAFLAGGGARVVDAVMAALYGMKLLVVTNDSKGRSEVQAVETDEPPDLHDVEMRMWRMIPKQQPLDVWTVHKTLLAATDDFRDRLASERLMLDSDQVNSQRGLAGLPFILLIGIGGMKLWLGLSRDKPVVFLGIMIFFTFFVLIGRLSSLKRRTAEGEAMWKRLRQVTPTLPSSTMNAGSSPAEMALMVALIGYPALAAAGGYQDLHGALIRTESSGSSSSGCSSSGCSSSDSGGSGCGGSSGCGGCGGGGD